MCTNNQEWQANLEIRYAMASINQKWPPLGKRKLMPSKILQKPQDFSPFITPQV